MSKPKGTKNLEIDLLPGSPQPNAQRVEAIRRWHIDQAVAEAKPVALLSLTITADGQLVTKGLGIEPVHAQIMLPELHSIIDRITQQLRPALPVAQFRRHA